MKEVTKILTFCLHKIPSVTLGVIAVLEELNKQNKIEYRFKESIQVQPSDIAWADIVIAVRSSEEVEKVIIEQAKQFNRYVIYFLDDDLLNVPRDSASSAYFEQLGIRDNMKQIMRLADILWTTSINIQEKYNSFFKESFVMKVPIEVNNLGIYEDRNPKKITIGFAGSIDHGNFTHYLLEDVVKDILTQYGEKVQFEFFGCKPQFVDKINQVTHIPYENDYIKYRETIISRKWDIGLAPLIDSEFHRCKYFNKYIEYASVGICGIYSDLQPLNFIIKNKINGILVKNKKEDWKNALIMLIEDENLRSIIRENSYKEVKQKFNSRAIASELEEKVKYITTFKAVDIQEQQVKLISPTNHHITLIKRYFKEYKLKAPFVIGIKLIKKIKNKLVIKK